MVKPILVQTRRPSTKFDLLFIAEMRRRPQRRAGPGVRGSCGGEIHRRRTEGTGRDPPRGGLQDRPRWAGEEPAWLRGWLIVRPTRLTMLPARNPRTLEEALPDVRCHAGQVEPGGVQRDRVRDSPNRPRGSKGGEQNLIK